MSILEYSYHESNLLKASKTFSTKKIAEQGFTLLEILLVIVIMTSIVLMIIGFVTQKADELRRDRAAMQIQMIENAALAYYVANSAWPVASDGSCDGIINHDLSILRSSGYLNVPVPTKNPWGLPIYIGCNISSTTGTPIGFIVWSTTPNTPEGLALAGRLPFGTFTGIPANAATSYVPVPGQNLNNARSVNFAGIYASGACVPAPVCPTGMNPSILVVPVQVNGANVVYDSQCGSTTDPRFCSNVPLYPVSSFVAYARGGDTTGAPTASDPLDCERTINPAMTYPCQFGSNPNPPGTKNWRVCLSVVTQAGVAYPNNNAGQGTAANQFAQGRLIGSVLAITRCVPNQGKETPAGSDFSVFTPNQNWQP